MSDARSAPDLDGFRLRDVHPSVRFGTASDRYAGWIGQVYPEHYASKVSSRKRELGGEKYEERTLPVESVADYFGHFGVLELDFTFYRPLLDEDGRPSSNYFTLERYAEHAPGDAAILLKAPQAYSASGLRRGHAFVDNPEYLDASAYAARFLAPARDLLGDRLAGVLFEQEYQRQSESPPVEAFAAEIDGFFARVATEGPSVPTHVEVRSPHLQTGPFFDVLDRHGLGFVFSHWTWLGPLSEQWRRAGERLYTAGGEAVVRLLTPLNVRYADAYAQAYPFDKPVPALAESAGARRMIEETVDLARKAIEAGARLNVIANNRAYGNAPALARDIARELLDAS